MCCTLSSRSIGIDVPPLSMNRIPSAAVWLYFDPISCKTDEEITLMRISQVKTHHHRRPFQNQARVDFPSACIPLYRRNKSLWVFSTSQDSQTYFKNSNWSFFFFIESMSIPWCILVLLVILLRKLVIRVLLGRFKRWCGGSFFHLAATPHVRLIDSNLFQFKER